MNLFIYLGMLHQAEQTLAESFRQVAEGHGAEPDVHFLCHTLAQEVRRAQPPAAPHCPAVR